MIQPLFGLSVVEVVVVPQFDSVAEVSRQSTQVMNKIIAVMDDVFGYGLEDTESSLLWNRDPKDIPLYGLDQSRS